MRAVAVASTVTAAGARALGGLAERMDALTLVSVASSGAPALDGRATTRVLRPLLTRSPATRVLVGLRAAVDEARPDVLHVQAEPWQAVAVQCTRIAKKRGIPVVILFAENGPRLRGAAGALRRAVTRRVLARCAYALVPSEAAASLARTLAPGLPVETMPVAGAILDSRALPTADPERWFGNGAGRAARVAFAGRLVPEKGVRDALAAADVLAGRLPVRMAIAGSGPLAPEVEAWVADRPWVLFHGSLEHADAKALLASADLLLMPSRSTRNWEEQLGRVALEAMSAGVPVVGYASGALPEVVGDGGVLVREGDEEALAESAAHVLAQPRRERELLADRARARAACSSGEIVLERLAAIWTRLQGRPRHVARGGRDRHARKVWRALRMPLVYRNWLTAYRHRFGLVGPDRLVYRLRDGTTLALAADPLELRTANEIWLDRVYEPSDDFRIRAGWTILDLGAHKGMFTVRAARTPGTEVHAVEPLAENLDALRENIHRNKLANVTVHAAAVAAQPGTVLLCATRETVRSSIVLERPAGEAVPVPALTLVELLDAIGKPIDLAKIDIEGAEHDVLLSTPPEYLARIRRIAMEYHASRELRGDAAVTVLARHLESHGFECRVDRERPYLFARSTTRHEEVG